MRKKIHEILEIIDDYITDWFSIVLKNVRGVELLIRIENCGDRPLCVTCYKPNGPKYLLHYDDWIDNKSWHNKLIEDLELDEDVSCWSISDETLDRIDIWINEANNIRNILERCMDEINDGEDA